jgi:hypothetical protein
LQSGGVEPQQVAGLLAEVEVDGVDELSVVDLRNQRGDCLGDDRPPCQDEEVVISLDGLLDLVMLAADFIEQGDEAVQFLPQLGVDDQQLRVVGVLPEAEMTVFGE